jgi:hypothetical protein
MGVGNTLAYYDTEAIMAVIYFIVQAPVWFILFKINCVSCFFTIHEINKELKIEIWNDVFRQMAALKSKKERAVLSYQRINRFIQNTPAYFRNMCFNLVSDWGIRMI